MTESLLRPTNFPKGKGSAWSQVQEEKMLFTVMQIDDGHGGPGWGKGTGNPS